MIWWLAGSWVVLRSLIIKRTYFHSLLNLLESTCTLGGQCWIVAKPDIMKKHPLGHYWHVFLFSCRHCSCTTVMTLREVTPDQAHQAVKGQNYKGGEWGKVRPWSEGAPLILASSWSVEVRQGFPSLPVAFLLLIIRGQWLVPSQGCKLPFYQQLLLLLPHSKRLKQQSRRA